MSDNQLCAETASASHDQAHKHGAPEHSVDNRAGWYILRCGAGLDFPAAMAVRNAGWNVFCAREKKWRVSLWRRKPSEGEADYPRFPGYLFVHVTPPAWPDLSAWPLSAYLSGVLTMGGRPVPLAAREIDRLRAEDGTNVPHTDSVPVHRAFAAGQRALVLAGAFCDFVATIEFIDEAGAHIAVPICGKPADVTLPLTWLRHA